MELSLLDLLTAPVTFPYKGFKFILEVIKQEVDKEMLNSININDKLLEIEYLYEMNEISEEEYNETKLFLIKKLREFKEEQFKSTL